MQPPPLTSLTFLAAMSLYQPAEAGMPPNCNTREHVRDHLAERYQEHVSIMGRTSAGYLMEIYTAGPNGTWTIVLTAPKQGAPSCVLGNGDRWLTMQLPPQS